MKLFSKTPQIPFVKIKWFFLATSLILIILSVFCLATKGLNYGIDFQGGTKLQYQFPTIVSEEEIRDHLGKLNLENLSVLRFGEPTERRLVIKVGASSEGSFGPRITPILIEKYGEEGLILEQEELVGPKVGKELQKKGTLSVLFSIVCMLVYIGFRFNFQFAPGAILALFHDVIIVLGFFSVLQIEFSLTILAALLTIVGYSVNDSIVVFDRVREHERLIDASSLESVVNQSLNETLSRTLITSLTSFFVVASLYFFGGATIRDFAQALMLGILIGTFSTFSIASPSYILAYRSWPKLAPLLSGKKA